MAEIRTAFEIKKRVWADPSRTPKDIFEELTKLGAKTSLSTVSTYRTDFLNSLAVLREIGALPPLPEQPAQQPAKAPKAASKAKVEPEVETAATPEAEPVT
jgi:hypothetical protein